MSAFTLVSTMEKRRLMFLVVPHNWVVNKHLLFWPKHLLRWEIEKLRSDCNSVPEENWVPQECVTKVDNIKSFESGLELEISFIDLTDTEAEERFLQSRPLNEKKKIVLKSSNSLRSKQKLKYDQMFIDSNTESNTPMKTVEQNLEIISVSKPQARESVLETINDDEILTLPDDKVDTGENNEVNQNLNLNQNEAGQLLNAEVESVDLHTALTEVFTQVIDKRLTKVTDELNNRLIQNNLQMCQINTKLDKLMKDVSNIMNVSNNDSNLDILEPNIGIDNNFTDQFPISDPNILFEFEMKLQQDDNFRKLLLTELCKFGGTNKNEQADKVVYAIFDFLFTPELLVQFSWTGASKSQDMIKQSFQKLHNTIDLIYDVLSRADSRHTKSKNESLIRDKVLKHTNQRLIRKRKNKNDMGTKAKKPNNTPIIEKTHEDNTVNDIAEDAIEPINQSEEAKETDVEFESQSSIKVVVENLVET